jgi:hypothetical protein
MATWRYKLDKVFTYSSGHLRGISFQNEWVTIRSGTIMIAKDYAWDGCSPAYYFKPLKLWLGTPDGEILMNNKPVTYYASLVHDALCQFRDEIYISKKGSVEVFRELLRYWGFPKWATTLYCTAVDLFGPQRWLGYLFRPNVN